MRWEFEKLAASLDAIDESVYEWQGDPKALAAEIRAILARHPSVWDKAFGVSV
jgi:hypothetical protein